MMLNLEENAKEWQRTLNTATTLEDVERLRLTWLGRQGILTQVMRTLSTLPAQEKQAQGIKLNYYKGMLQEALSIKEAHLRNALLEKRLMEEAEDVTLMPPELPIGRLHPIMEAIDTITTFFIALGFTRASGPQLEDEFHNFTALNIPEDHPARGMHDTFYLKSDLLLRTHTSCVQIRTLHNNPSLPLRIIAPGRVYRKDHDVTHVPMFHQVEGLVLEEDIHLGHLKGCLQEFLEAFFAPQPVILRYRPSFFPFTEPSFEVDIWWTTTCEGETQSQWLEVLGCGMVHPYVLKQAGIPKETPGFAFGLGIERLVMLRQGVEDVRKYYSQHYQWLNYYGTSALGIQSQNTF